MNRKRLAILVAGIVFVPACGRKVDGIYSGHGQSFLDKLNFKSDGKVELTFLGMTKEGTYVVADNKVKVTNGNDTQILTIDDQGCLDGGGILGKYCKDGSSSRQSGSDLAGTYRAGDASGGITLRFQRDQKVRVTVADAGTRGESADGTYKMSGNRVTITVPGGMPMTLNRKGNSLEGSFDGRQVQFVKQ